MGLLAENLSLSPNLISYPCPGLFKSSEQYSREAKSSPRWRTNGHFFILIYKCGLILIKELTWEYKSFVFVQQSPKTINDFWPPVFFMIRQKYFRTRFCFPWDIQSQSCLWSVQHTVEINKFCKQIKKMSSNLFFHDILYVFTRVECGIFFFLDRTGQLTKGQA